MVTATALALPQFLFQTTGPAMNTKMFDPHPATQANLKTLKIGGYTIIFS